MIIIRGTSYVYGVSQKFKLMKRDDHFWVNFELSFAFFEAARVVLKIGSSLKSNYHKEI